MNYKVIGISGPARVGKDTAAKEIKRLSCAHHDIVSFADPIKLMLMEGLNLSIHQVDGDYKEVIDERYGCTPRHLMQTLGTEWGREMISQDIWVNALKDKIIHSQIKFIIPDVRFESEAKFVRENGIMINIVGKPTIESDHISERGVTVNYGVDSIIHNDSSLDSFLERVKFVVDTRLK